MSKLKNNKLKTMDFETESSLINEGNIIESLSEIKNIIKTIKKLK